MREEISNDFLEFYKMVCIKNKLKKIMNVEINFEQMSVSEKLYIMELFRLVKFRHRIIENLCRNS